jgi:hypothetical protein
MCNFRFHYNVVPLQAPPPPHQPRAAAPAAPRSRCSMMLRCTLALVVILGSICPRGVVAYWRDEDVRARGPPPYPYPAGACTVCVSGCCG